MFYEASYDSPGLLVKDSLTLGPFIDGIEAPSPLQTQLEDLRRTVHQVMDEQLLSRIGETYVPPTDEEIVLGSFMEGIEPQVLDTVRIMNIKGYPTNCSGFFARGYQAIAGRMGLSDKETESILATGANVTISNRGVTYISFVPEFPNLSYITNRWMAIAYALEDRGHPSVPFKTAGLVNFWEKYCTKEQVNRVIRNRIKAATTAKRQLFV
jgi:hypothetical protein